MCEYCRKYFTLGNPVWVLTVSAGADVTRTASVLMEIKTGRCVGLFCLSKPLPPSRGRNLLFEALQLLGDFVLEPTQITEYFQLFPSSKNP